MQSHLLQYLGLNIFQYATVDSESQDTEDTKG